MGADRIEHFGALHLYRGRLWLGKPRGVRGDVPLARWMGACLGSAGIRCYEGSYFARRRTAWDEITSIGVRFDAQDATGYGTQPGYSLAWEAQSEDPQRLVSLKWMCGNAWNRSVMLLNPMWNGEVTEQKTHAVRRLPDALRLRPGLRQSIATEGGIADLLGQLAAAPDIAAIDRILGGGSS